jgi:DNA-binding transcriptional regulator YiaG
MALGGVNDNRTNLHVPPIYVQARYYPPMPDIAATLKAEITRIARKEIRSESADLKKAATQHRTHIAALRRRLDDLERQLNKTRKARANAPAPAEGAEASEVTRRFSAARLAATRKKLGLSAEAFGALIGVTGPSIYKWESGSARPRAKQLEAIASVRGMGKREAARRLQALGEADQLAA